MGRGRAKRGIRGGMKRNTHCYSQFYKVAYITIRAIIQNMYQYIWHKPVLEDVNGNLRTTKQNILNVSKLIPFWTAKFSVWDKLCFLVSHFSSFPILFLKLTFSGVFLLLGLISYFSYRALLINWYYTLYLDFSCIHCILML
jgi:hypothetical protein